MRLPVDNWHLWYVSQGFGIKTTYGYHEAVDLNLKTGGDTDLGQPIFSIADGIVTSIHNHTGKPTFGNHIHIQHDGPWGTVYCHHAHCQEILVEVGNQIKEGQMIARIGKSGTELSHDHWAIKLQPTGIDGIAKTQEDLKKWIGPIAFVEKWMNIENEGETAEIKRLREQIAWYEREYPAEQGRLTDCRKEKGELQALTTKLNDDLKKQEEDNRDLINQVNSLTMERDTFRDSLKASEEKLKVLLDKVNALESEDPLAAYSGIALVGRGIAKILRRR